MLAFVLILLLLVTVPTPRVTDSLGRARIAELFNAGDKEGG